MHGNDTINEITEGHYQTAKVLRNPKFLSSNFPPSSPLPAGEREGVRGNFKHFRIDFIEVKQNDHYKKEVSIRQLENDFFLHNVYGKSVALDSFLNSLFSIGHSPHSDMAHKGKPVASSKSLLIPGPSKPSRMNSHAKTTVPGAR